MIPLSRVRLSPEKVGYVGVAQTNLILGPILGQKHVLAPPRSLPGIMINMKTLSFWCHDSNNKFRGCPQKMDFGPKISFFLRYAHITHFFGLRRTRLNGIGIIISPMGIPMS